MVYDLHAGEKGILTDPDKTTAPSLANLELSGFSILYLLILREAWNTGHHVDQCLA